MILTNTRILSSITILFSVGQFMAGSGQNTYWLFQSQLINIMSKEAVLLVLDVGNSMDEPFNDNDSRAKIAFECCKLTMQQKIFNNSSHELGLIIFGDNDSDDGNSLLLQPLEKPNVDLIRKVEQLSQAHFDNNTLAGGDIFSAINYSLNQLNKHCGKKKYNKRMFVFTNGMGESSFSSDEISTLARKLTNSCVKLNIIPIDFMTSYNSEENCLDGEMLLQKIQEGNAQMIMRLKQEADEFVQIFPASLAIELYKRFRKRDTNPVSRYKGVLQFAPGLQIEVNSYKAIRRQKLKSLARYDTSGPFDRNLTDKKDVILEYNYVVQGDESGKIVDKENIMNAFYYGPQLVPISPILQAGTKIFQDKNFRLLGFIDKSKVPRHALMGDVDIVIPAQSEVGRKLFSSFIYSMISLNKYGLARYVPRNSKNGVVPKMVVLIPYRSTERQMFYLIDLPTVEDVRDYPFNPLKQSTQQQKSLIKELIDKMMLVRHDGEEVEELVKVQNTFNPQRQYFYQCIFYKALNDDENQQLPPLDPIIKDYLTPQQKIYTKTGEVVSKIKKQFRLVKKINLAEKNKKKTLVWKDVIEELSVTKETMLKEEEGMEEEVEFVKPQNKFSFEHEEEETAFNPSNPILSFKKMINYHKEDLVSKALQSMNSYITNKLAYAVTEESFKQLTECATELRNGCISQQEQNYWDAWFTEIRYNYPTFYGHLKNQGIGMIYGDNTEVFKVQTLHRQDIEEVMCDLD